MYVVNFSNIGLREFSTLAYRLEIQTFPELTNVKLSFVFKAPVQLSPVLHSKNFGIFTLLLTVQNDPTFYNAEESSRF
jgi:hypothetical protein